MPGWYHRHLGQPDTVGWAAKCDDFSMAHNRKRSHGWRSQAKPKAHGLHTDAAPHRPGAAQNSPTAQPSLCARRRRVQGVRRSVPKISPESKKNILLSPAPGGKYRYARVRERERERERDLCMGGCVRVVLAQLDRHTCTMFDLSACLRAPRGAAHSDRFIKLGSVSRANR